MAPIDAAEAKVDTSAFAKMRAEGVLSSVQTSRRNMSGPAESTKRVPVASVTVAKGELSPRD